VNIQLQINKSLLIGRICIWYYGKLGRIFYTLLDKTPQLCDSTVRACLILQFCLQEEWVSVLGSLYKCSFRSIQAIEEEKILKENT